MRTIGVYRVIKRNAKLLLLAAAVALTVLALSATPLRISLEISRDNLHFELEMHR